MTGIRSDVRKTWFGSILELILFKGIEHDDLIRDTRGSRNQGWGADT